MNPIHPKLRRALLADPEHRSRGLTSRKFKEYEELNKRLENTVYYPPREQEYGITEGNIDPIAREIAQKRYTPPVTPELLERVKRQLETIMGERFKKEEEFLDALKKALESDICRTDGELRNTVLKLALISKGPLRKTVEQESQPKDPIQELIEFRAEFMPNFEKIRDQFVRNQWRELDKKFYEQDVLKIINLSFRKLGSWFSGRFWKGISDFFKRRRYEKKD